jgi:phospholipid-binding lipoprotein MlaA
MIDSENSQIDFMLFAQNRETVTASEEGLNYMEDDEDLDYLEEDMEIEGIPDPLEPVNRVFFKFNDKLYFWIVKPIARGYGVVVPEGARISVKNVFNNISTPIRLINNLLQMKVKNAGDELLRFGINTTFGMFGLYDVAKTEMGIEMHEEDFGQTLAVWGAVEGIYHNWPFFGPFTTRDTVGFVGDLFLDPLSYVFDSPSIERYIMRVVEFTNKVSLSKGEYEDIKKDAFDHYEAVKDIYDQYRDNKIKQ